MINAMAQEPAPKKPAEADDPVDKFLAEQQARDAQRDQLIKELLRQKEAAIKAFDDKLAKLGHEGSHGSKRSHHTKHAADKKASG